MFIALRNFTTEHIMMLPCCKSEWQSSHVNGAQLTKTTTKSLMFAEVDFLFYWCLKNKIPKIMYDSWIILIIVTMNTDEVYKFFSNLFFHEVIKIFPVGVYYHNLTFPKGFRCKSIHIYDIIIILEFIHFISSTILYLQLLNISNSKHTKSLDIIICCKYIL